MATIEGAFDEVALTGLIGVRENEIVEGSANFWLIIGEDLWPGGKDGFGPGRDLANNH